MSGARKDEIESETRRFIDEGWKRTVSTLQNNMDDLHTVSRLDDMNRIYTENTLFCSLLMHWSSMKRSVWTKSRLSSEEKSWTEERRCCLRERNRRLRRMARRRSRARRRRSWRVRLSTVTWILQSRGSRVMNRGNSSSRDDIVDHGVACITSYILEGRASRATTHRGAAPS